jgi:hypothetical protein
MRLKNSLTAAVAVVIVVAGVFAATRDDRETTSVVVAARDLSRYTVVAPKDIKVEERHVKDGTDAARDAAEVRDKVTLKPVGGDSIVKTTDVVPGQWIAGRSILDVQVIASSSAPDAGEHFMLVVSPKSKGFNGFVLDDVTIVRITKTDKSMTYTIALSPADLDRLAPVLAVAELRFAPPASR